MHSQSNVYNFNVFPSEQIPLPAKINLLENEIRDHIIFLSTFRVYQCEKFKRHCCDKHKPFTCFNWHFENQRRRCPFNKSFTKVMYHHDRVCGTYDSVSGKCSVGDKCPYAHQVYGDMERLFHPFYYKTSNCSYKEESIIICSKNGTYCAFAHDSQDMRSLEFLYGIKIPRSKLNYKLLFKPPKDQEEPVDLPVQMNPQTEWDDEEYLLHNFKTLKCLLMDKENCDIVTCPFYHGTNDFRRDPYILPYKRSCNEPHKFFLNEDNMNNDCMYCHNIFELLFHPLNYKTRRCNLVAINGWCYRGIFCPGVHVKGDNGEESSLSDDEDEIIEYYINVPEKFPTPNHNIILNETGERSSMMSISTIDRYETDGEAFLRILKTCRTAREDDLPKIWEANRIEQSERSRSMDLGSSFNSQVDKELWELNMSYEENRVLRGLSVKVCRRQSLPIISAAVDEHYQKNSQNGIEELEGKYLDSTGENKNNWEDLAQECDNTLQKNVNENKATEETMVTNSNAEEGSGFKNQNLYNEEYAKEITTMQAIITMGAFISVTQRPEQFFDVLKKYQVKDQTVALIILRELSKKLSEIVAMNPERLCIICYRNYKEVIFNPCRHSVLCTGCSETVLVCPLCGENIISKEKFNPV